MGRQLKANRAPTYLTYLTQHTQTKLDITVLMDNKEAAAVLLRRSSKKNYLNFESKPRAVISELCLPLLLKDFGFINPSIPETPPATSAMFPAV